MKLTYVNYIITFISFLLALYLIESFLEISNILQKTKQKKIDLEFRNKVKLANNVGINFDERSMLEVHLDFKKDGIESRLIIKPTKFISTDGILINGEKIFPLAGISKVLTINCNENGKVSTYISDRFGFSNDDSVWDENEIEILIIGDSFAHGACVDQDEGFAKNLKSLSNKNVVNLGFGANGPLLEYATYVEYGRELKAKNVLWFYYEGNDLRNLRNEIRSEKLFNYLISDYKQNLKNKQNIIDKYLVNYLNKNLAYQKKKTKKINYFKIIKFGNIRDIIYQSTYFEERKNCSKKNISNFFKVINKINTLANKEGSNFYFIYLPTYYRYTTKNDFCRSKILKNLKEYKINFIDIENELFSKTNDPFIYFPLKLFGHYTPEGYQEISKIISDRVFTN
tara:strand:- start:1276 stop:2469 length:1194 start_codon:yes stop_codon:yes gene_type:complete